MTFWQKIKFFLSNVWAFIKPTVDILMTEAGNRLMVIATNVVKQIAADPRIITDDAKRQEAFNLVVANLKSQGLEFGDSVINRVIELAVGKLKAQ